MVSRIRIGPEGGPFVKIDEDNGTLKLESPSGDIDLQSNKLINALSGNLDLTNSELQNAVLLGATLGGALNADGQDITNADTVTTDTLDSTTVDNAGTVTTTELIPERISGYLFCRGFPGADADARFSNAISASQQGDVLVLENQGYTQNQTVPEFRSVVGTCPASRAKGSHLDGATLTLEAGVDISNVGLFDGSTLQCNNRRGVVFAITSSTANSIIINDDFIALTHSHSIDLTITSTSTDCVVTNNTNASITDNGARNVVANNT